MVHCLLILVNTFHLKWGETEPIAENIDYLNNLYNTGKVQIILTTARTSEYEEVTKQQLENITFSMIELYLTYFIVSVI